MEMPSSAPLFLRSDDEFCSGELGKTLRVYRQGVNYGAPRNGKA